MSMDPRPQPPAPRAPFPARGRRERQRLLTLLVRGASMALGSLTAHPLRSLLTLNGIVLGITSLVVMLSALDTLERYVRGNMFEHGEGVFRVQREPRASDNLSEAEASARRPLTLEHVRGLREGLREVDLVAGEMWSWGNRVTSALRQTEPRSPLVGASEAFLDANNLKLGAGRGLSALDVERARTVALVGSRLAERLFPGEPARALGQDVTVRGRVFTVVGVLAPLKELGRVDPRNEMVVIPLSTFERVYGLRSLFVTLRARAPERVEEARHEATALLRSLRGVAPGAPDDFLVVGNGALEEFLQGLSLAIGVVSGGVALLALLIGGVGLMNVTLISVARRRREIGLRKALGARPSDIFLQFLLESLMLALVGGAAGVAVASLLVLGAGALLEVPTQVPVGALVVGLVSTTLTGFVAGTYPASRAARLEPIESLRAN